MRVLVVTNAYPTEELPSAGTFVGVHVQGLRAAGVDVDVLHLDRASSGRHVYRGLGERVRRAVASGRPDVVHVAYGGVMADLVTRALPEHPVVVSFCGSDLLGGDTGWILERLSRRYGVRASYRAARRADAVIAMSQNLLDALPPDVPRSKAWIVPYGIDLERFRPRDRASSRRELRWDERRRHVLFPASPSRPEKRYRLAAGAVRRLVDRGLEVDLHALDRVPHQDVPVWIAAADAVVLTSEYEGSPNAVKEALACNVAVVSVDVGDVGPLLDRVDGCYVASPTADDVADKLERVLRGPARIDGRSSVEEYAVERVTDRVRSIFETVAGP